MLHIERAARGTAGWQAAHDWLTHATRDGLTTGADACLFHGAPALAFTLHPVPLPGYRPARQALDNGVTAVIRDRLAAASERMAHGTRPSLAEFDLISGLTGLGAHLWRHHPGHSLVTEILGYLVRLTEPLAGLPGWWTPSPPGRTAVYPPGGHGNNGMAHGTAVISCVKSLTQVEVVSRVKGREARLS